MKVQEQWRQLADIHEAFVADNSRGGQSLTTGHNDAPYRLSCCEVSLDFSRQQMPRQALELLCNLAASCKVASYIEDYFSGQALNTTENRAVLHTALRASHDDNVSALGTSIADDIQQSLLEMAQIADAIGHGDYLGASGLPIKNIVHIGIGGSDLGAKMSTIALKQFANKAINTHFISDVDPSSFDDAVDGLFPPETLFIIASKSFTTQETLYNAQKAKDWLGQETFAGQHFIAVTANAELAAELGFSKILPLWDWVGGRFSLCSAVSLVLMIAIGKKHFHDMLSGAHAMDHHFRSAEYATNLPVLLALIGIWNVNFRQMPSLAIMVYNRRLKYFTPYIQQLEMESNGKSMDRQGQPLDHETCPVVWGGMGNRAEHAYYQLLSQGCHKVALDCIFDASLSDELVSINGHRKIDTLSRGRLTDDRYHIPGGQAINTLTLSRLTPYTLGALCALYEHKVFVQGVIWGINSFDQCGIANSP